MTETPPATYGIDFEFAGNGTVRHEKMKSLRNHLRIACRVISVLLLCAGAFVGYWWFYKLAPWRRTFDPQWTRSHSQLDFWRELQNGIHRVGWSHDAGFTVGAFGDKSWMEWLIHHIKPGTRLDGCLGDGLAHADGALRSISNQDVGKEADAWLAWWEKNKSKSQLEWLADGFRQFDLALDVPPKPEQIPILLGLLGNSDTNALTAVPQYLKLNAFRCLRDSGFEPVGFALSNETVSIAIKRGLQEYAKRERLWPAAIGVGILPLGKEDDNWRDFPAPAMLTRKFQAVAYTLVFGPLLLGSGLLVWSLRRKEKSVEPEGLGCGSKAGRT